MQVLRNLAICHRVKELCPDCKTAVGGHHATLLPEDFFEPQIDFVVVGEGAVPFRHILQAQQGRSQRCRFPGCGPGSARATFTAVLRRNFT